MTRDVDKLGPADQTQSKEGTATHAVADTQ